MAANYCQGCGNPLTVGGCLLPGLWRWTEPHQQRIDRRGKLPKLREGERRRRVAMRRVPAIPGSAAGCVRRRPRTAGRSLRTGCHTRVPHAFHWLPDLVVDCTKAWPDSRKAVAWHPRRPRRRNAVRLGLDVPTRVRRKVYRHWCCRLRYTFRLAGRLSLGLLGQGPPSTA